MSAKTHYWLAGPDGNLVQVEGAVTRDELAQHGWTEAGDPGPNDRVWLQHNTTGGFALFGAQALEPWQAIGWQFAVPPTERGDYEHVVALPEPAAASLKQPEPDKTPEPAAPPVEDKPKTESVKEKSRG